MDDGRASLPVLYSVIACDGEIFLEMDDSLGPDDVCLRAGSALLPCQPSKQRLDELFAINLLSPSSAPGRIPFEGDEAGNVVMGVDLDEAWKLSDTPTYYFSFPHAAEAAGPVDLFLTHRGSRLIELPAGAFAISARCAAHRGKATFRVRTYDTAQRETARFDVPFDDHFAGGPNEAGYKAIEIALGESAETRYVSIGLSMLEVAGGPDERLGSYIFLANPSLHRVVAGSASRPVPRMLVGSAPAAGSRTVRCPVDPHALGSTDGAVKLVVKGRESELFAGRKQRVARTERADETPWLTASEEGAYALYIDGAYAQQIALGPEPRPLALPIRIMDGSIHHVTIRDRHGMSVLFEDYVALPALGTPYDVLQREARPPYPSYLSPAARFRYLALERHIGRAAADPDHDLGQVLHAHAVLEAGFEKVRHVAPLRFPEVADPDVSVIVPVHNNFDMTYYCLCALLFAANEASFEVIVVDDGSTDRTTELPELVTGVTCLRNDEPERFIRACNRGAAAARGRFVVLLNNDTEPAAGWLDELLAVFRANDGVGLVGAKLLNGDGSLQEAGGIVWRSGNPWNYGRGANPWDPRFCYVRDADYLSGAALMVSREAWEEVGGLSAYLEPMYFDDTDLAFKLRQAGWRTMFAPHALVWHFEGRTSGTDVTSGMKRYQEVNRTKFRNRWAKSFLTHAAEGKDPDLEKDRGIVGRVAVLDHQVPRPDLDAGSYAAIQEIRLMRSLGLKVTFVPENMAHLGSYTEDLQRLGVETVHAPFCLSVQEFIERRGDEFDAFYITRYQVAQQHMQAIRTFAPRARILFNNADLHFLRELRAGIVKGDRGAIERSLDTRAAELRVVQGADVTLSYNEVEHAVIMSHVLDTGRVVKCPWVVEAVEDAPGFESRAGIAFLGGYAHPPNVEAVDYFIEKVLAGLIQALPEAQFHIYGSQMPERFAALASDAVRPEGYVEDVREVYDRHRVFVAPLLSGAGIKGKVLGALAHGIPCVLSPVAAEGIGLRSGYDCIIAEKPEDWIEATRRLHSDADLWNELSRRSRDFVREGYSFEGGRELMKAAFEQAGVLIGE